MDTGDDPRFKVLEKALSELKVSMQQGRIKAQFPRKNAADAVERGQSALKALQYSYAEPEQIVQMPAFNELMEAADVVETLLGGPGFEDEIDEDPLAVAEAAWTISTIRSLKDRLYLTGSGLELGVDAMAGRVVAVREHPKSDDLLVTRVAAGASLPVVTNDTSVKAEDRVGVAFLPPTEIHGTVSRGMFLGAGDGVLKDVRPGPDDRPEVPPQAYAETRNMLAQYIGAD